MSASHDPKLSRHILVGLAMGVGVGLLCNHLFASGGPLAAHAATLGVVIDQAVLPVGRIFLRLIFMVVIPLIISAIAIGALDLGDARHLGRVGLRTLLATLGLSATSVAIALLLVNTLQPGRTLPPESREQLLAQYAGDSAKAVERSRDTTGVGDTLLQLIPDNPLREAVNAFDPNNRGGGMLAVMVFAVILGLAMAAAPPERVLALKNVLSGLFDVCMIIIGFALKLAPVGVACLGFALGARLGIGVVQTVGFYVVTVLTGLALHQFVTYPVVLKFFGKKSPVRFFAETKEAMVTAFATSSSNATLPVSLRVAEENLRLPPKISRFVLTVGASANQNGTALYEGITVLFLAQVFGVDLSMGQQFTVALMCVLAGVGTAGVPGGSLPLVAGVLATIGVQPESIAIILGVDRLLDMCRTVLNVTGDMVVAVLVSRGETPPTIRPNPQRPDRTAPRHPSPV